DRFVPFPGYPGFMETNPPPEVAEAFVAQQRAYGYDLVIQMHGSGTVSTPFCLKLGGRMTAGYYQGDRPSGLTHGLLYADEGSEIWRNLELARAVGCVDFDPELEFPVVAEDRTEARRLLGDF